MAVLPVRGRENVYDVVVWTLATDEAPRKRITYRVGVDPLAALRGQGRLARYDLDAWPSWSR